MRNSEEAWIYCGVIDNLRIQYILRNYRNDSIEFVARLEYNNKPVIGWDKSKHEHYHVDYYDVNGKKITFNECSQDLANFNEQINFVFNELESVDNFVDKLSRCGHIELCSLIIENKEVYLEKIKDAKQELTDTKEYHFGIRHFNQQISVKANIVNITDSLSIELRDPNGHIKNNISV